MIIILIMQNLAGISLEWLKTFVVFCESSNIYEAARRRGLSQPAVTQHLQRLEASVGVDLFNAEGKKKVLTVSGKRLYEEISQKLNALEGVLSVFLLQKDDLKVCRLRVGVRHELFSQVLDRLAFPGILELIAMSANQSLKALENHQIDCAFVHEPPANAAGHRWLCYPMIANHAVLLVHRKLSLKGKPTLPWALENPCFLYREDAPLLKPWIESINGRVRDLRPKLICSDWNVLVRTMESIPGYSVIPSDISSDPRLFRRIDLPADLVSPVRFFMVFPESLNAHPGFRKYLKKLSGPKNSRA